MMNSNQSYGSFVTTSQLNKSDKKLSISFGNSCTDILCNKIIVGSIFSINNELKVISEINKSTNKWDINFYPAMKVSVTSNANVEFINPRGVFRLVRDEVSFLSDEFNNHTVSLSFQETT